ncbi:MULTISPECIES: YbaB/EbfC family nucleoid-associated protein [Thermomonosporaceae]|uniref:YbaB/EbfC family nucleoid-associated protein n=1 Tax=Thermomonosporaceae TaxID=2012 RepID=UPI00255AF10D|nr:MULTISPECIES: YbaB/EbfC family nucleoid-associated protein [Thermomonosporaceae]MDL4772847.1 YbaB/EbfC family nucleoid-associated protein [Actinomadura xylanilytica]
MDDFKKLLGFDPEKLSADAGDFFARMRDMQEGAASLTARAESVDHRIAVEYSSDTGVRAVHIDPRAMRMGAAELGETILALIQQAQRDVETQGRAWLTEMVDADNALLTDRSALGKEMQAAAGAIAENLRGATAMVNRLQADLRR